MLALINLPETAHRKTYASKSPKTSTAPLTRVRTGKETVPTKAVLFWTLTPPELTVYAGTVKLVISSLLSIAKPVEVVKLGRDMEVNLLPARLKRLVTLFNAGSINEVTLLTVSDPAISSSLRVTIEAPLALAVIDKAPVTVFSGRSMVVKYKFWPRETAVAVVGLIPVKD